MIVAVPWCLRRDRSMQIKEDDRFAKSCRKPTLWLLAVHGTASVRDQLAGRIVYGDDVIEDVAAGSPAAGLLGTLFPPMLSSNRSGIGLARNGGQQQGSLKNYS
jgi:hypothetical protein